MAARRRLMTRLIAALVLPIGLLAAGCAPATESPALTSTATETAAGPDATAGLIALPSGRRVYVECEGQGEPTVVFVSGGGLAADEWNALAPGSGGTPVFAQLAETNRVCAYDRPGTARVTGEPSRSEPVELPRTLTEMAEELNDAMDAAGEHGPFIVVAHSFGSPIARLYAGMHPDDIAGLVWVDAGYESFYRTFEQLIGPAGYDVPGIEYDLPTTLVEMDEQFAAHPLPAVPTTLLEHSRDRTRFPNPMSWDPSWPIADLEDAWASAQNDLAALTPRTTRVVADDSGHLIMVDEPDLLVDAIRQTIAASER